MRRLGGPGSGFDAGGFSGTAQDLKARINDLGVNVKDYGAIGDNVADDTAAIQAAIDFAKTKFGAVYFPSGTYKISSTLLCGRIKVYGDGDGSQILPTISNGTPALKFDTGSNHFSIEDLHITNPVVLASFLSGAVNGLNCTGIKIGDAGFSNRYHIKNVRINGLKTGIDIYGFIGSIENLFITACELAFKGNVINSTRINLRCENNRQDLQITASSGVHFDQFISEGGVLPSGLIASTIDSSTAISFTAPYFEQTRSVPFIVFGGVTECKGVTLESVSLAATDGTGADYNIFPLVFDKVNGLNISGWFSTGSRHSFYSVTENTKNIYDNSTAASITNWGPHDNSKNLSRVLNYFPNSNFDLWFRGYNTVFVTRSSISKETTLVRRGRNAMKLMMNASETNSNMNFVFNDSTLGVKLAGKTVTMYAWIWIPDTSDFDANDTTSQALKPSISIYSDGTGAGTTSSETHSTARGAWNLLKVTKTLAADATRIDLNVVLTKSTLSVGTEFIVVDSVYLIEGNGQDLAIKNGWISESELNPMKAVGGKMILSSNAAPTDTDLVHEVGDIVYNSAPIAGGSIGWTCVTAGSPGTWKTFGTISA